MTIVYIILFIASLVLAWMWYFHIRCPDCGRRAYAKFGGDDYTTFQCTPCGTYIEQRNYDKKITSIRPKGTL